MLMKQIVDKVSRICRYKSNQDQKFVIIIAIKTQIIAKETDFLSTFSQDLLESKDLHFEN
ncbi:hypothetical protein M153_4990004362 [Pseudoloma neurophilia]|uniref:Uncharacterized protein n=1 Tax=Pseudoloma neurophilia TaxID=146866 RepID=A0A0R0M2Q9_9MICR|nr:hypothetical protein M153_4990004362 [Pseudoloma neurophilia]